MSSRIIRQIILFQIICWVIAANLYMSSRVIGLEDQERIQLVQPIRLTVAFGQATAGGILIGLILGLIDIGLLRSNLRKRSFSFLVFSKGFIYILSIIVVLCAILLVTDRFIDHKSWESSFRHVGEFLQQRFLLSLLIYALFISFLVSFIKQVNQKFGPGILVPLIFGRYYKPKEEERIFMFLDLRSSTTHAEKIGHVRYSELIQDCFYDLAPVVENTRAAIYQYVGDEAVISWKLKQGLEQQNCLRLFFLYRDRIESRKSHYLDRYGMVPEFKAGLNSGLVTVAEVGEVKKEIAYHGDVLNTAARIQSRCNDLGRNFLISGQIRKILPESKVFRLEMVGEEILKGKEEPVTLFSVERLVSG